MRKTILLKSRYGEIHKLKRIGGNTSRLFLFAPVDDYYRLGYEENSDNNLNFVDPSGGPFIQKGAMIDGFIVKSISIDNGRIIIEFE